MNKKWEYMIKELDYKIPTMKQIRILDRMGSEGWELINCVYNKNASTNTFYFKKPGAAIEYR
jgi:hypothetical protein